MRTAVLVIGVFAACAIGVFFSYAVTDPQKKTHRLSVDVPEQSSVTRMLGHIVETNPKDGSIVLETRHRFDPKLTETWRIDVTGASVTEHRRRIDPSSLVPGSYVAVLIGKEDGEFRSEFVGVVDGPF